MTTNCCYTHNKPNCKSQYCDVASGKCIKKTKAGRPYKTKLETDLGSSYYYDEKYGLVGTKESVKTYIKELSKNSGNVSKKSLKDKKSRSSEKAKKSRSFEESESVEKSRSAEKVKKPKKTSPPKSVKNKGIVSSSPSSKSMKEIQKRISDIMSGEDDISMDSFLKSNPILTKTKSKKTKKAPRVAKNTRSTKISTATKSPVFTNISQKRLRDYRAAIGLVDGECYG